MTELAVVSDAMLDRELDRLYLDHRRAMDDGDNAAASHVHGSVMEILSEFSRRVDVWLEGRG